MVEVGSTRCVVCVVSASVRFGAGSALYKEEHGMPSRR